MIAEGLHDNLMGKMVTIHAVVIAKYDKQFGEITESMIHPDPCLFTEEALQLPVWVVKLLGRGNIQPDISPLLVCKQRLSQNVGWIEILVR